MIPNIPGYWKTHVSNQSTRLLGLASCVKPPNQTPFNGAEHNPGWKCLVFPSLILRKNLARSTDRAIWQTYMHLHCYGLLYRSANDHCPSFSSKSAALPLAHGRDGDSPRTTVQSRDGSNSALWLVKKIHGYDMQKQSKNHMERGTSCSPLRIDNGT